MFQWYKNRSQNKRAKFIAKCLANAYEPLFYSRNRIIGEMEWLSLSLQSFETLQADMRDPEGKDEAQCIKELWLAMKFDSILEHYRLAINKIKEVLDNMPTRPDSKEVYDLEFYGPNSDDDDL